MHENERSLLSMGATHVLERQPVEWEQYGDRRVPMILGDVIIAGCRVQDGELVELDRLAG